MHNDRERDARQDARQGDGPPMGGERNAKHAKEKGSEAGSGQSPPAAAGGVPDWLVSEGLVEVVNGRPWRTPAGDETIARLHRLPALEGEVPHYCKDKRELWLRGACARSYRRAAHRQIAVLEAFED